MSTLLEQTQTTSLYGRSGQGLRHVPASDEPFHAPLSEERHQSYDTGSTKQQSHEGQNRNAHKLCSTLLPTDVPGIRQASSTLSKEESLKDRCMPHGGASL